MLNFQKLQLSVLTDAKLYLAIEPNNIHHFTLAGLGCISTWTQTKKRSKSMLGPIDNGNFKKIKLNPQLGRGQVK